MDDLAVAHSKLGDDRRAIALMGELLEGVDRAIGMQNASSKRTQELEAKLIELEQMLSAASEFSIHSSGRCS